MKMAAVHTGACGIEDLRVLSIETERRPIIAGCIDPWDIGDIVEGVEILSRERITVTLESSIQTTEFLAWWEYEIAAVVG